MSHNLPNGWAKVKLGDVLPVGYGKALPARLRESLGRIPVVGSSGPVGVHDTPYTSGPTLVLGRKGNVGSVYYSRTPCWPIDTVYFAEPTESVCLPYFAHVLRFLDLRRLDTSTTIPGLSRDAYNAAYVPVAPLLEQRRIVEAIESLLTRLGAAAAALERAGRNLERYRASVLVAAVGGRLVQTEAALARAEGRDYEPASVLLERLLAERRQLWVRDELAKMKAKGRAAKNDKWRAKYKEPSPPEMGNLSPLPEGWCWASVEQLGFLASGQTPRGVTSAGASQGDVPWFRVGDMNAAENRVGMNVAKEWLSSRQVAEFGLHVRPAGTIVFPKRGGAIRTNKKRLLMRPSTYDLNTMGIVPVGSVGRFLWTWFLGVDLGSLADGSNVPQINHGDVAPLPVPLPPGREQVRIVDSVSAALSVGEDVNKAGSANRARINRLRQAVLKWALGGKLVDQDPNDEPAVELLERIRAERAAASSLKAGVADTEAP